MLDLSGAYANQLATIRTDDAPISRQGDFSNKPVIAAASNSSIYDTESKHSSSRAVAKSQHRSLLPPSVYENRQDETIHRLKNKNSEL